MSIVMGSQARVMASIPLHTASWLRFRFLLSGRSAPLLDRMDYILMCSFSYRISNGYQPIEAFTAERDTICPRIRESRYIVPA